MLRQWLGFLVIGLVVSCSMLSRSHRSFTRLLQLPSAVLTLSLAHSLARSVVCVLIRLLTHLRYFYAQYLNCLELLQKAKGWCKLNKRVDRKEEKLNHPVFLSFLPWFFKYFQSKKICCIELILYWINSDFDAMHVILRGLESLRLSNNFGSPTSDASLCHPLPAPSTPRPPHPPFALCFGAPRG